MGVDFTTKKYLGFDNIHEEKNTKMFIFIKYYLRSNIALLTHMLFSTKNGS